MTAKKIPAKRQAKAAPAKRQAKAAPAKRKATPCTIADNCPVECSAQHHAECLQNFLNRPDLNLANPSVGLRVHVVKHLPLADTRHRMWRELAKARVCALAFSACVETARRQAADQVGKARPAEWRTKMERVKKAADELLRALDESPLEKHSGRMGYCLEHPGLDPVDFALCWRGRLHNGALLHSIAADELLQELSREVARQLEDPPWAWVQRQRNSSKPTDQTIFVRSLMWQLLHEYSADLPGTVASVANMVFQVVIPEKLWDVEAVRAACKPTSQKLKTGNKKANRRR